MVKGVPRTQCEVVATYALPIGERRYALELTVEKAASKPIHHSLFEHQGDSVGVQVQIAQSALRLRTARLHACTPTRSPTNSTMLHTEQSSSVSLIEPGCGHSPATRPSR